MSQSQGQGGWNPDIEFPSQNGKCISCGGHLNKRMNGMYDATTLGYCNKLCLKSMDKKLINEENLTSVESEHMLSTLAKEYFFVGSMNNKTERRINNGVTHTENKSD